MSSEHRVSTAKTSITILSKSVRTPVQNTFHTLEIMDSSGRVILENLPFSRSDTTAGTETELQVAVYGSRLDVDLPRASWSSTLKDS